MVSVIVFLSPEVLVQFGQGLAVSQFVFMSFHVCYYAVLGKLWEEARLDRVTFPKVLLLSLGFSSRKSRYIVR